MLTFLFKRCLNEEEIPTKWRNSNISTVHTRGRRIYSRVLRSLIEEDIKDKQPEEQAGFLTGKTTTDNNIETHTAFIALEKAYDSIPVSKLWQAMQKLDIRPSLVRAVQHYYKPN